MGGRGAYYQSLGERTNKTTPKSAPIIYTDLQLGKKIGKHAKEFGFNPADKNDREKFVTTTSNIIDNPDQVVTGSWRGQSGISKFYIKGNDVVVVNEKNEYVTTMKDGIRNKRIKKAIEEAVKK